jgi:hypothetical protein
MCIKSRKLTEGSKGNIPCCAAGACNIRRKCCTRSAQQGMLLLDTSVTSLGCTRIFHYSSRGDPWCLTQDQRTLGSSTGGIPDHIISTFTSVRLVYQRPSGVWIACDHALKGTLSFDESRGLSPVPAPAPNIGRRRNYWVSTAPNRSDTHNAQWAKQPDTVHLVKLDVLGAVPYASHIYQIIGESMFDIELIFVMPSHHDSPTQLDSRYIII